MHAEGRSHSGLRLQSEPADAHAHTCARAFVRRSVHCSDVSVKPHACRCSSGFVGVFSASVLLYRLGATVPTAEVRARPDARTHTYKHARTHTRARARAQTYTHTRTRTHKHTHTRTQTCTHKRAHTHARTHARAHTHARAQVRSDGAIGNGQLGAAGKAFTVEAFGQTLTWRSDGPVPPDAVVEVSTQSAHICRYLPLHIYISLSLCVYIYTYAYLYMCVYVCV